TKPGAIHASYPRQNELATAGGRSAPEDREADGAGEGEGSRTTEAGTGAAGRDQAPGGYPGGRTGA
uniref:hypothetical protein n=1 Tax=Acetobacter pasteurianus TaxID=438 RepID=UPI0018E9BDFE